jgi:hypothetical protein
MTSSRAWFEPIDDLRYRITFGRPVEADVALMYFGFYQDVQLFWKDGRVTSVVAPGETYQQILADFSKETAPDDDSDAVNRAAGR